MTHPNALSPALRLGAALLLAATLSAQAAPLPNPARLVSITAREQPLASFLQDLFAAMDVPAAISPTLNGAVNGSFAGPAERVLKDVSRVFNLVSYYDGSVVHVVPASELVRRSFNVPAALAERVLRDASEQGLPDTRNTVKRSGASLLAVGTKRFIEQVEELTRVGDTATHPTVPAGSADFRVFYLRYGSAQDTTLSIGGRQVVVPGVASILRGLVGARAQGEQGSEVLLRPSVPGLRGQGLSSQGAALHTSTSTPSGAAPSKTGDKSADLLVSALSRTAQNMAQEALAATAQPDGAQVRIEADQRLNAVIVRDLAERLPRYEQLIASLDVEPQTLEIEATIIDVNTDRMRELGVNWRWANAGQEILLGNGSASDLALRNGQTVTPSGRGGVVSAVLGSAGQFVARISALQAEGAARIVSSPQVVTLSNVEAVFDNSSTFYVRVAGREQVDLFNVSAGTSLRVKPNVFRDRESTRIKLNVVVEDGNLTNRQVDQIPVVERSTVNTQALITEGESLLIGGMVRDATSSGEDKVPGLGDVPLLGRLFKTTTSSTSRVERMFLITPRLAGSRAPTSGVSSRQRTPLPPTATPTNLQVSGPVPASVPPAGAGDARVSQPAAPALPVQRATAPSAMAAAPGDTPAAGVPSRASVVLDLDAAPSPRPAAGGPRGEPSSVAALPPALVSPQPATRRAAYR
ncbi:type III secretion outer membrane pore, YscC/HrcC family [Burkholderiales bacterium JOSHI_001]|nr:type III secretion outer membrane pore, YscC/HrcC family [Burkholderiales bacterium JOSHI_001]